MRKDVARIAKPLLLSPPGSARWRWNLAHGGMGVSAAAARFESAASQPRERASSNRRTGVS